VECAKCGGSQKSESQWATPSWRLPQMVSASGQGGESYEWIQRGPEPVNKWQSALDMGAVYNVLQTLKDELMTEVEGSFTNCMYSAQAAALKAVATACATAPGQRRSTSSTALDAPYVLASETVYVGTADTVGNSIQTHLQVASNTFAEATTVSLWESSFLPRGASAAASSAQQTLSDTTNATMYDASCFTVVTNNMGRRMGQLMGNCVQLNTSSSFTGTGTLCVATDDFITRHPSFTAFDFASRSGSTPDDYVYTAMGVAASPTQSAQLCADVSNPGWICPIMRVENSQSITTDVGSSSCPALDRLVAKAQLSQRCSNGDQSSCNTLSTAETAEAAAAQAAADAAAVAADSAAGCSTRSSALEACRRKRGTKWAWTCEKKTSCVGRDFCGPNTYWEASSQSCVANGM